MCMLLSIEEKMILQVSMDFVLPFLPSDNYFLGVLWVFAWGLMKLSHSIDVGKALLMQKSTNKATAKFRHTVQCNRMQ